jgi:hypothetical protein
VLVPDLSAPDVVSWPAFRDGAIAAGMQAAFGFPLRVGGACIGALNLFHATSGALTAEQYEEALVVAHVAGRIVMGWQAVVGGESVAWQLEQIPAHRAVVHQASGMVSLQAGVSVDDALVILQAHAFAQARTISDVAADVVGRVLRFDREFPQTQG